MSAQLAFTKLRLATQLAAICCLGGVASGVFATQAPAQRPERRPSAGYAEDSDFRFRHHDRRVKVVLLAGSIGAFRNMPYGRLIHNWCENAEVRNVSRVGQGAPQLLTTFREDVIRNPHVPVGAPNVEMWLLFGGGLNSVSNPHRTSRSIRRIFTLAHRRQFGVVGLSLTPWGSAGTPNARLHGAHGVHLLRSTRHVVDFVMGRLGPEQALGRFAQRERAGEPSAAWGAAELPNVAIDLYDSPLRNAQATPLRVDQVRRNLQRDRQWQNRAHGLAPEQREVRLNSDAQILAEAPRWSLRPEYRSFDDVHPNRAGHRLIAELTCPRLPASWGCRCPSSPQSNLR